MPTTRPRTQITHTGEIERALEVARQRWPGQQPSALLAHLIEEGARAVESTNGSAAARHRAALAEVSGSFPGAYGPGYLDELREGWPE